MSDEQPKNQDQHDSRGGGNVWLVLIAIVSAVMLSAFLFGNTDRRIRYPELMLLLERMAQAHSADQVSAANAAQGDVPTITASEQDASEQPASEQAASEQAASERGGPSTTGADVASAEPPSPIPSRTAAGGASTGASKVKIVVPSTKNPESLVELSDLQDILVSDGAITGTVVYRSLGLKGREPIDEAKSVGFQTIRDTKNE